MKLDPKEKLKQVCLCVTEKKPRSQTTTHALRLCFSYTMRAEEAVSGWYVITYNIA